MGIIQMKRGLTPILKNVFKVFHVKFLAVRHKMAGYVVGIRCSELVR